MQHDQRDDLEQIIDLGEWEPMSQQQPEQILNPDPSDPVIDDWDLGWPSMEPSTDPGTIDHNVQDQDAFFFFEGF